jgi:VanZ family protein
MDVSRSRWLLPVAVYAAILALSTVPASSIEGLGLPGWLSYLGHALEYGALGASLAWAGIGRWGPGPPRLAATVGFVVGVVVILGGVDELYQSTIPGRDTSVVDLAVDVAAAGIAAWVAAGVSASGVGRWSR